MNPPDDYFPAPNYQLPFPSTHPPTLPVNPPPSNPIQSSRRKCTVQAFDGEQWATLGSMEVPDSNDPIRHGEYIYCDLILDREKIKSNIPPEYHPLIDDLPLTDQEYKHNVSELKITYSI